MIRKNLIHQNIKKNTSRSILSYIILMKWHFFWQMLVHYNMISFFRNNKLVFSVCALFIQCKTQRNCIE